MRQLFRELKRRNVYKVAVTYAVVAFVSLQAVGLLVPATTLPSWTDEFLVALALFGFPVAIVLAWAFEMTPEGVRRTPEAEGEAAEPPAGDAGGWAAALVVLLVAVAGGWYLTGGGDEPEPELRAGDRSIAVLPFENMGGEESEQFTRGVHGDLLTRLAHVSGLKVVSRTAVEAYRDTDLTTGGVADSLGVRWVLEGAVQKMGDEIQVNAQLIDPRTETHLWADRYRRNLTAANLFDLQSEITKRIARSLETELTPEETRQVERRPTEDLEAYQLYVQGRSHLDTRTEEGMRQAVDYFRRAIRQDSSYALAWSGLADAVGLFRAKAYASPEEPLPDQEAVARRALELGPDLADAHASMGYVQYSVKHDGPAALRMLRRAVELKPSYAQAHHWLGFLQLGLGRLEEAREHISLAVELNPRHGAAREALVWVHLAAGDLERARSQLEQFPPDYPGDLSERAWVLYHEARWDELERLSRERLAKTERYVSWAHFYLARTATLRGDTASAREHLRRLREMGRSDDDRFVHEGLILAALGEEGAAFEAWGNVERWRLPTSTIQRYLYPDLLAPLREDPRYRELIRRINEGWGLNPDGSLPDSVDVSFDARADE